MFLLFGLLWARAFGFCLWLFALGLAFESKLWARAFARLLPFGFGFRFAFALALLGFRFAFALALLGFLPLPLPCFALRALALALPWARALARLCFELGLWACLLKASFGLWLGLSAFALF